MGLYALYGGVVVAVSGVVLGVVGDDSGGLAGYKGEEEEEEEDGGYQILCKIYYSCVVRVRSQTPPPLLKGGEGVRGRDGTLGFKPHSTTKRQ